MGTKHSAFLPNENNHRDGTERTRRFQNSNGNDTFNPQFQNQIDPFQTFNRRQSMIYNYNCVPPKPPRANAENVGAAANRIISPVYTSSPIIDDRKNNLPYRMPPEVPSKPSRNTVKSSLDSKLSLIQELIECPICFNFYDNPHVLPCQHTFCKKCIISMQMNSPNNAINCPICRETHTLKNGVESLTANYTVKRLIELESIAAAEKEKEKLNESNAKCFGCQKYAQLKVCTDCSYMLCPECVSNPDHDYIIESKINSKKYLFKAHRASMRYKQPNYEYSKSQDVYNSYRDDDLTRLKLTLLCHSSAVEEAVEKKTGVNGEVLEDEFGNCKTFQKISISDNDRVITLKKIVERKFGIQTKDQILVYKDQILKSDLKPLSFYGLRQFSRIHIFDERDIKDNDEEDLYGIYQDTNMIQLNDSNEQKNIRKNEKVNNEFSSKSSKSSSSSQANSSFENPQVDISKYQDELRRRPSIRRIESRRSNSALHGDHNLYSRNYYNQHSRESKYASMSRYRRLDDLYDQKVHIAHY